MDIIMDVTPVVMVMGLTSFIMEMIKPYLPAKLYPLPILILPVAVNYLIGLVGLESLEVAEAIKWGFVTSGMYGLGKKFIEKPIEE